MAAETPAVYRRRRAAALSLLVIVLLLGTGVALGVGGGDEDDGAPPAGSPASSTAAAARGASAPRRPTLPDGTRSIFPEHRAVALYGNPADDELGALGIGSPARAARRLRAVMAPYDRRTRPAIGVMELITTVAAGAPGDDGKYRIQTSTETIERYLRAARRARMLLVLDIQPGVATFPEEVRRLRRFLREPDVGLALDPEWRIQEGEVPGQVIGTVSAEEVNEVSAELAEIVREGDLPEKLFVIHQFTEDMVRDKQQVQMRPGLATVFNVDGFGGPEIKRQKYRDFTESRPRGAYDGFKVFFREDTDRLSPQQVMALAPRPAFVVYE